MQGKEIIILLEDDIDDQEIFEGALMELYPDCIFKPFSKCSDAWHFLLTTTQKPFLIFCDINMPGMSGLEFKSQVDKEPYLRKKSIPFVFYSTSTDNYLVDKAYSEVTIQGFFKKPVRYADIKLQLKIILEYWGICVHPNSKS